MGTRIRAAIVIISLCAAWPAAAQVTVNANGTFVYHEVQPNKAVANQVVTGVGNCTTGTHVVAVTLITSGGSTEVSPISNAVTCDGSHRQINVTVIYIGSIYVTGRDLWMSKANTTTPLYRVSTSPTIADNTTTTYTINVADSSLSPITATTLNTASDTRMQLDLAGNALVPIPAGRNSLGSVSLPWKDLYLSGAASDPGGSNYRLTGTPTTTRTIALPDVDFTVPAGLANPSALVGLTGVNGSAETAMRSDGAPALNQAIAPTWTGAHLFKPSSNATTAFQVQDSSAAIVFDVDTTNRWVGINTTTPASALTVVSGAPQTIRMVDSSGTLAPYLAGYSAATGGTRYGFLQFGSTLATLAGEAGGLTISSGNVGVNENPSAIALFAIGETATTGTGLYVHRNLASGSTDSALVYFRQQHASDDQPALYLDDAGTGGAIYVNTGNAYLFPLKSTTGVRYLCVDTAGKIVSQAAACSGT